MFKGPLDWTSEDIVNIYDEAPLWSAKAGMLLLNNIPMQPNQTVVDLGFGTGFPLIELAQRYGSNSRIIGVDIWKEAMFRTKRKVELLELTNVELIDCKAAKLEIPDKTIDLVCSNMGINNFEEHQKVIQKVYKMLKLNGHFCFTTNDNETFKELFHLFKQVLFQLNLNNQPLEKYIAYRTRVEQLLETMNGFNFELIHQIKEVVSMRFSSAEAVFNHSIIRIAFLKGWQALVPKESWSKFLTQTSLLIDEIIKEKGYFSITTPIHYLEFTKTKV